MASFPNLRLFPRWIRSAMSGGSRLLTSTLSTRRRRLLGATGVLAIAGIAAGIYVAVALATVTITKPSLNVCAEA